jgi:hypothetical protein
LVSASPSGHFFAPMPLVDADLAARADLGHDFSRHSFA